MFELILVVVGIAIVYQSYKLIQQQKELRAKMDKMKEDFNIEYGAVEGTGIHVVKKQYPDLEIKDDFREKVSEPTSLELRDNSDHAERHNIAGSMNGPSEMQKKAFEDEK